MGGWNVKTFVIFCLNTEFRVLSPSWGNILSDLSERDYVDGFVQYLHWSRLEVTI